MTKGLPPAVILVSPTLASSPLWPLTSTVCCVWISFKDADVLGTGAPPHAGPSTFTGGGGDRFSSFGGASSAPLRNIERPPFFVFFLDTFVAPNTADKGLVETSEELGVNPAISLKPEDTGGTATIRGLRISGVKRAGPTDSNWLITEVASEKLSPWTGS